MFTVFFSSTFFHFDSAAQLNFYKGQFIVDYYYNYFSGLNSLTIISVYRVFKAYVSEMWKASAAPARPTAHAAACFQSDFSALLQNEQKEKNEKETNEKNEKSVQIHSMNGDHSLRPSSSKAAWPAAAAERKAALPVDARACHANEEATEEAPWETDDCSQRGPALPAAGWKKVEFGSAVSVPAVAAADIVVVVVASAVGCCVKEEPAQRGASAVLATQAARASECRARQVAGAGRAFGAGRKG